MHNRISLRTIRNSLRIRQLCRKICLAYGMSQRTTLKSLLVLIDSSQDVEKAISNTLEERGAPAIPKDHAGVVFLG